MGSVCGRTVSGSALSMLCQRYLTDRDLLRKKLDLQIQCLGKTSRRGGDIWASSAYIYIHTRHLKAVGLNEVTMGVSVEKAKRRLGDQGLGHLEVRDIRKKQQRRLRKVRRKLEEVWSPGSQVKVSIPGTEGFALSKAADESREMREP